MNYPINYDFGKHWNSKIRPHLDNPNLLKAIREGINDYSAIKTYRKNTIPALYSSKDHYDNLLTRKDEMLIEQLRKDHKLPLAYLKLEEKMEICDDDDQDKLDRLFSRKVKMETMIFKQYRPWNVTRYDLESYYVSGACHSWAPTFELTLARLVEPEEKWTVRRGKLHSTVINATYTLCFDLLYWTCYRIENYMFGDPLHDDVLNDLTLGGQQAYVDSS